MIDWVHCSERGYPIFGTGHDGYKNGLATLTEGQHVLVGMVHGGFVKAIIKRDKYKVWYAESKHSLFNLDFCERRKCWVNVCALNKKALECVGQNLKRINNEPA